MPQQRTVLVGEISYRGVDGEDHVAHCGDVIQVADEGVTHFDWVHEATPEATQARRERTDQVGAAEKPPRKPAPKAVEKD